MTEQINGEAARKPLGVFAIIKKKDPGKPSHWLKIGSAFTNRDGSLTLLLDAFPIGTHKLQVRESRPWDDQRSVRLPAVADSVEAQP